MTKKITLLDGGMGQELLARSNDKTPRMWSATYLMDEPELVEQIHRDYIEAGARVITINAYSASYNRMASIGAADRVPELQKLACELALSARDAAGPDGADIAVAGCLPPLNGSYRADRVREYEVNLEEYRKLVGHQAPYVDFFICETMSSINEARAAATAASESGKPFWVGCTLLDNGSSQLRSGETIDAFYDALKDLGMSALIANCSAPESMTTAMPELAAIGLPTGAYANGFTGIPADFVPGKTYETLSARRDLGPEVYADYVMRWVDDGASIVGGCCEVGPAHIAEIRDRLAEGGYETTGLQSEALSGSG